MSAWDKVDCEHLDVEEDIVDLGDDGDGYVAYGIFTCLDCGTTARTAPPYDSDDRYEYRHE